MEKEAIWLCKIASEIDDCDQKGEYNSSILSYENRKWKMLDFLQENNHMTVEELRSVISGDWTNPWNRRFSVQKKKENGHTWLVLCFKSSGSQPTWTGRFHMPQKLFLSFFYDADDEIFSKNIYGNSRLMKKYVTAKLFDALYQRHLSLDTCDVNLELPACFLPKLRRYQEKAVAWLCKRERQLTKIPHLYTKLSARDKETCVYAHKLYLHLLSKMPEDITIPRGGILADEMGLGKTVEIIALILLHTRPPFVDMPLALSIVDLNKPREKRQRFSVVYCLCGSSAMARSTEANIECTKCQQWQHLECVGRFDKDHGKCINQPYICPRCWIDVAQYQLVQSHATFIVTPNAIKNQWLAEIRKHVYPNLNVFVYDGIAKVGWVSPRQLANYDIVLTDYDVLRKEVYRTNDYMTNRETRNKPRHMRCNTPILMVEWWRVCLDEAQMVENCLSNVAQLAFQIPAINRWAVTGTPIQKSIDDLHSLLAFVGFKEICYPHTIWDNLVINFLAVCEENAQDQPNFLVDLLQKCMWRTCKSKVDKELDIPPQREEVHFIKMRNLEKLFYSEQHAACENIFNDNFDRYVKRTQVRQLLTADTSSAEISPQIMKILLQPLLKIRQCCTIPVLVKWNGGKTIPNMVNNSVAIKKFLQPKDLHKHLKTANEQECKAELRTMASSYNGMAAIYFIRKKYRDAIRYYELVLKLARDYDGLNISVDSLLQVHALHNILQACNIEPQNSKLLPNETTLKYEDQCKQLEWKYLEPYASNMKRAKESFESGEKDFDLSATQIDMDLLSFVSQLADIVFKNMDSLHDPLWEKIYVECACVFPTNESMKKITSMGSALYVITIWYEKVVSLLNELRSHFQQLKFFTENVSSRSQVEASVWRELMQFVTKVFDCHLSEIRVKQKANEGKNAQSPCDLCIIRDKLNSFECLLFNKIIDAETNNIMGIANPSPHVTLIKVIFSFTKSKTAFNEYSSEFEKHYDRIKFLETLCKRMWKFWIEIEYTVKAYDELDMCKMRISITNNLEDKSNFKLLPHEVNGTFSEQQLHFANAQARFVSKFARLKYILHLETNADPGACPICHSEDELKYAVLMCGHHICLVCLKAVQQHNKSSTLSCSICRNQQNAQKIYYVTRINESDADDLKIKGKYTSKISFIVHQVLKLQQESSLSAHTPKILIFSQWEPILSEISVALKENGINHRYKWSQQSIEEFKNPHLGITCMLMPFSRGSKGLNLIEATHVFLVEPILNPAEELQAIGRVHRFGQTRPTTVHRFIVLNSVEENIYNIVTKSNETSSNWKFENIDLESLRSLFNLENDVFHSC